MLATGPVLATQIEVEGDQGEREALQLPTVVGLGDGESFSFKAPSMTIPRSAPSCGGNTNATFAVGVSSGLLIQINAVERGAGEGDPKNSNQECAMAKWKMLTAVVIAAGLMFGAQNVQAHCDSLDGPVAKAVHKALETGNVNLVLVYAPAKAEAEIRASFEKSRKVRGLGGEARALADEAFLETVIRLHRAGEGAPYTGLKPAGIDYGPVIRAAEHAVESGDLSKLKAALNEEIEHALSERLTHVRELQKAPIEPKTANEVSHSRERVSAELGFITFAETIRQAAHGKGAEHHAD